MTFLLVTGRGIRYNYASVDFFNHEINFSRLRMFLNTVQKPALTFSSALLTNMIEDFELAKVSTVHVVKL